MTDSEKTGGFLPLLPPAERTNQKSMIPYLVICAVEKRYDAMALLLSVETVERSIWSAVTKI